jgi:hypothetical protein
MNGPAAAAGPSPFEARYAGASEAVKHSGFLDFGLEDRETWIVVKGRAGPAGVVFRLC